MCIRDRVYEFGGGMVKEHLGGIYEFLQKKKIDSLNELQKGAGLSASPTATAKGNGEQEACLLYTSLFCGSPPESGVYPFGVRRYETQLECTFRGGTVDSAVYSFCGCADETN